MILTVAMPQKVQGILLVVIGMIAFVALAAQFGVFGHMLNAIGLLPVQALPILYSVIDGSTASLPAGLPGNTPAVLANVAYLLATLGAGAALSY